MILQWMNWLYLNYIAILPFAKYFQYLISVFSLYLLCTAVEPIDISPVEVHGTTLMTTITKSVLQT